MSDLNRDIKGFGGLAGRAANNTGGYASGVGSVSYKNDTYLGFDSTDDGRVDEVLRDDKIQSKAKVLIIQMGEKIQALEKENNELQERWLEYHNEIVDKIKEQENKVMKLEMDKIANATQEDIDLGGIKL